MYSVPVAGLPKVLLYWAIVSVTVWLHKRTCNLRRGTMMEDGVLWKILLTRVA